MTVHVNSDGSYTVTNDRTGETLGLPAGLAAPLLERAIHAHKGTSYTAAKLRSWRGKAIRWVAGLGRTR
jgi:hypothetical protein